MELDHQLFSIFLNSPFNTVSYQINNFSAPNTKTVSEFSELFCKTAKWNFSHPIGWYISQICRELFWKAAGNYLVLAAFQINFIKFGKCAKTESKEAAKIQKRISAYNPCLQKSFSNTEKHLLLSD